MDELITSAGNATVKRVRALADRKHRRREGAFVVEGLQPVWRAVTSGWPIETIVTAPDLLANPAAQRMVDDQRALGTRIVRVRGDIFGKLSTRDGPAGLLAIVRGAVGDLADFRPRGSGPVVALHRAGNPGNVGTILRSADASGAAGAVLVGPSADPLAPAAVKSSMGSVFAVPMARARAAGELFDWAGRHGRGVVAVSGRADSSYWRSPIGPSSVLLFGSEGDGLPDEIADRCESVVAIPMEGTAESLNLATAASLVLYELKRRRAGGGGR